jgi:voltage-gated potassium channel
MATLVHVLKRERRTLAAALVLMLVMLFFAASLMYFAEHEIQPEAFASIPHALWWGVATLTTVGYGDVVPQSVIGRMLGMIIMLLGIAMFALPAGILASAFTEEARRRNFIVTWNMVAQVPFFSRLSAKEIAKVGELLHLRIVMPNEIVFQRDEEAEGMYFIVSGEVEVEVLPEPIRLRKGDFFGEMGILYDRKRSVTVMALTYAELLELDAKDFRRAFDSNPKLKQRITEEAERRMAKKSK